MGIDLDNLVEVISLTDLDDVTIASASQYDHLEYNGSEWVNVSDVTILGTTNIVNSSTSALLVEKVDGTDVLTVDTTNTKLIVGGSSSQIGVNGDEDLLGLASGALTINGTTDATGNIEIQKTGSATGFYADRTDGAIGAFIGGLNNVAIRFDTTKDFFKIQTQPRASLEAQDGTSVIDEYTFSSTQADFKSNNFITTGNIDIDSDSSKLRLGGGQDASIYFDGADFIVNSENVTANDEVHIDGFTALQLTNGKLILPATIEHLGDTDTTIVFAPDKITLNTGGFTSVEIVEDTTSYVKIGDGNDINFYIQTLGVAQLFQVDAGNDTVRMGDSSGSNYTQIDADGDITQAGTARIDWTKISANGATVTGCTTGSSVSDLQSHNDGNVYTCTEVAATPNFLVVDFTSVTAFNWVQVLGYYDGNAVHNLVIQLEVSPFDGSTYHTFDSIEHQGATTNTMQHHSFFIPSDAAYINSGTVNVRILHSATESNGHTWVFDEVSLYQ